MNINVHDNKKIVIVSSGDLTIGSFKGTSVNYDYLFLDNDFICNFNDENGGVWKSVTHYINAKKFEGTQYEEEIRNCESGIVVKLKSKETTYPCITFTPKGVVINTNKVIGPNINTGPKLVTSNNENSKHKKGVVNPSDKFINTNLKIALKLKFNGRLYDSLVNTRPHLIISRPNPLLGKILMKMRDEKDLNH